jgi:bifunctional DNase/RNase
MTADKKFKRLIRERGRRTGESYTVARHWLLRRQPEETLVSEQLIPVRIAAIKMNAGGERDGTPVVDLAEIGGDRHVYIMIGRAEAKAIGRVLQGSDPPRRPLPHDVLSQTVDAFGGRVERIVVRYRPDDLVFTAEVTLTGMAGEEAAIIDARPSDALALAVRRQPGPDILAEASTLHEAISTAPKRGT